MVSDHHWTFLKSSRVDGLLPYSFPTPSDTWTSSGHQSHFSDVHVPESLPPFTVPCTWRYHSRSCDWSFLSRGSEGRDWFFLRVVLSTSRSNSDDIPRIDEVHYTSTLTPIGLFTEGTTVLLFYWEVYSSTVESLVFPSTLGSLVSSRCMDLSKLFLTENYPLSQNFSDGKLPL